MTRPPRRPAVRGCRAGWLPPTPTRLAARPRPLGLAAEPAAAEPVAAEPVAAEAPPAARLGAVTTAESLAALHKASQGLVSSQSRADRAMTTHRRHRLRPVQRRPAQPQARPPPAPAATATPCCCGLFWVSRPTRGRLSWQVMMRWRLAQARPNQLQLQLQLQPVVVEVALPLPALPRRSRSQGTTRTTATALEFASTPTARTTRRGGGVAAWEAEPGAVGWAVAAAAVAAAAVAAEVDPALC